ncbi:hypothetical protein ACFYY1_35500 [Streptomyces sp. NPDC001890]|uniref:hypothetical protein n=1 Tax=Streptomyces sp. NPDC001890 TaxID=3364620 RepID=UPI0036B47298
MGDLPPLTAVLDPTQGTVTLSSPEVLPLTVRRESVDRLADSWNVVPTLKRLPYGLITFSAVRLMTNATSVTVIVQATSSCRPSKEPPERSTTPQATAELAHTLTPWANGLDPTLVAELILHDDVDRHHVQLITEPTADPHATAQALAAGLPMVFDTPRAIVTAVAVLPSGHNLHISALRG